MSSELISKSLKEISTNLNEIQNKKKELLTLSTESKNSNLLIIKNLMNKIKDNVKLTYNIYKYYSTNSKIRFIN